MKKGQRNKGGGKNKNKKKRGNNKSSANNNGRPKLRFKYGDRVESPLLGGEWETGTVTDAIDVDACYIILMDSDGALIRNHANKIRKSNSPPLQIEYPVDTRIECKKLRFFFEDDIEKWTPGEEWRLGTVIATDNDWAENVTFPYMIKFDDEEESSPFIGPKCMIRRAPLRFGVGDRVELKMWWKDPDLPNMPGTIVELWPKCDSWEDPDGIVPYGVRLDNSKHYYWRYDTDEYIISSEIPPVPVASFMKGDRVECKKDEMWHQGTVIQSNLDWAERDCPPFYIRFDSGKYDFVYGIDIRACDSDPLIPISEALEKLGLSDNDSLFEPPPPMPDCPICFLPLPIDEDKYVIQACCGAAICCGCQKARFMTEGVGGACPFCRASEGRSDDETVRLMKDRVELNDIEMTFTLGVQYNTGSFGLPIDHQKAHELYVRAADMGCPRACTNAAHMFEMGEVVEKDEEKQIYYLEKGAKLGQVKARHNLGNVAAEKEAWDLAHRHWKISASAGYQPSLDNLKSSYKRGMLSKEELTECLRAHHEALSEEWSEDRAQAAALNDSEH